MVSVTTLVSVQSGICTSAKVILGAVGPTFIECTTAEKFLAGKTISESIAEHAGELAVEAAQPRTSTRASAEYRRSLIQILVKRCLLEAVSELK